MLVVDVDNKENRGGSDSILEMELKGFAFPKTLTQKTPTGGLHYIYSIKTAIGQGTNFFTKELGRAITGIDTRSKGGYIVGAGSTVDGQAYTIDATKIVPAPKWLVAKLKAGAAVEVRKNKPGKKVNQKGCTIASKSVGC